MSKEPDVLFELSAAPDTLIYTRSCMSSILIGISCSLLILVVAVVAITNVNYVSYNVNDGRVLERFGRTFTAGEVGFVGFFGRAFGDEVCFGDFVVFILNRSDEFGNLYRESKQRNR